jgi:hypothetical protein
MDNVLILATDHNVCSAYIEALKANGFKPGRILLLDIGAKQRRVGITRRLKIMVKAMVGRDSAPRIPKWFNDFQQYCLRNSLVCPKYELSVSELLRSWGWSFDRMIVGNINDSKLVEFLRTEVSQQYIVFCGGGILRKDILRCGKKFIHIHPGVVPDVKGSDGLLWSVLLRKKIGMSAFFMNEGIDTGDILLRKEYAVPFLNLEGSIDADVVTRELINYVDPVFRAEALITLFKENANPSRWKYEKQNSSLGRVYYFMHSDLKKIAMGCFIDKSRS